MTRVENGREMEIKKEKEMRRGEELLVERVGRCSLDVGFYRIARLVSVRVSRHLLFNRFARIGANGWNNASTCSRLI